MAQLLFYLALIFDNTKLKHTPEGHFLLLQKKKNKQKVHKQQFVVKGSLSHLDLFNIPNTLYTFESKTESVILYVLI